MKVNKKRAIILGLVAGLVLTFLLWAGRQIGINANMAMILGTMTGLQPGTGAWLLGFSIHLATSAVLGLLYAAIFERIGRASKTLGSAIGLIHGILAGTFLGLMPLIHPLIPEQLPAPGAFIISQGLTAAIGFVFLHVLFGDIMGGGYSIHVREDRTVKDERRNEDLRRVS